MFSCARVIVRLVSAGAVVQTKGKGATGSFKLSIDKPKDKAIKGKAQRASLVHSDITCVESGNQEGRAGEDRDCAETGGRHEENDRQEGR